MDEEHLRCVFLQLYLSTNSSTPEVPLASFDTVW